MAPLTLVVMVIKGLVLQPWFCMVSINGSYSSCLWVRACSGNLSWQYVKSTSCIVWVGEGRIGVDMWAGAPSMFKMFGLNLAWHRHVMCEHVHLISHYGVVLS